MNPDWTVEKMKQLGKPLTVNPCSVRPPRALLFFQRPTANSTYLISCPAGKTGADLEAGCEDQAIEPILATIDNDTVGCNPFDTLAAGVDQSERLDG